MNRRGFFSGVMIIALLGIILFTAYALGGLQYAKKYNYPTQTTAQKMRINTMNLYVETDQAVSEGYGEYISGRLSSHELACDSATYFSNPAMLTSSVSPKINAMGIMGLCVLSSVELNESVGGAHAATLSSPIGILCGMNGNEVQLAYTGTYPMIKNVDLNSVDANTCHVTITDSTGFIDWQALVPV